MNSASEAFNFIENIDIFGKQVPSFSLGGRTEIRTKPGAIMTIMILSLTLLFGLMKLQHLFLRKNPLINTNSEPLADDAVFETNSSDLMIAVTAENYFTGAGLSNPRYVRYNTGIWKKINGVLETLWYPMHKCTAQDHKKFNKAVKIVNNEKMQRLRNEDHLFCIDERALGFDIKGSEE